MAARAINVALVDGTARRSIEDAIDRLLSILDTIDGDADFEPEPLEPYLADAHHDREGDPAEGGIGDRDALDLIERRSTPWTL